MDKIVRLGTVAVYAGANQQVSVFCRIRFNDGRLSITGVEGPKRDGNAWGGCGQIVMHLKADDITPAPGWDRIKIAQFLSAWDEWHLNDMTAGSPAQTAWVEAHKGEFPGYPVSHYAWARDGLRAAGLSPDPDYLHNGKPYTYGTAWLTREVPADVLEFLRSLPDTDTTPAWV